MAFAKRLYGRTLQVDYFPLAGDQDTRLHSLVSARLYSQEPTEEQLADVGQLSTGHIGNRVLSWDFVNEEGTGAAGYRFTFPALPLSMNRSDLGDLYVVALNFLAEASGPELQDTERFYVFPPDGILTKIRVSAQDVYDLESKIKNVGKSQLWMERKIDAAIEHLLARLKARGYTKRDYVDLEELNISAKRLACAYACRDLISDGDPSWSEKHGLWKEEADFFFGIATVRVSTGSSDSPEPAVQAQRARAVAFLR